ncbi:MAG: hypothetical protein HQ481_18075 [Alphaproteobacteria bacterium]|nr:hypothetical protein [Alphaproteobacteria bacterium]
MSDGPWRSLNMRSGWKGAARCAENEASTPDEISERLPRGLEQDWRAEVSNGVCRLIRSALDEPQTSIFGDARLERLEAARKSAEGYPLASILVECAVDAVRRGLSGDAAFHEAARDALIDRTIRGVRQAEEHYLRKKGMQSAAKIRERLESAARLIDHSTIANGLTNPVGVRPLKRPVLKFDIDDGVQL